MVSRYGESSILLFVYSVNIDTYLYIYLYLHGTLNICIFICFSFTVIC